MSILEKLNWRYAVKEFDAEKKLSEEQVNTLVESFNLTATSFGIQALRLVQVEDTGLREKVKEQAWGQSQITDASQLFILCSDSKVDDASVDAFANRMVETRKVPLDAIQEYVNTMKGMIGKMDDDRKANWMARQVYIALGTMLTAAAVEGIDACPMEGFNPQGVDEVLGLKEKGLAPVVICTVGFRAVDDSYQNMAKVRKSKEEILLKL
ncbi:MAG: NAD(P)H-dependent oxidoreductase [Spirochaetota bacterium]